MNHRRIAQRFVARHKVTGVFSYLSSHFAVKLGCLGAGFVDESLR